ncbi:hypothetical protein SCMU_20280 [Sinomonas cyclohexanicum]|uniref:Uncharacterized protein n=1 Tax=Sinomonas cyclohexanicum TaxID=322009 RepID=A0ABM7PV99_SINCY|nr:hypothetical protein SCMU_20280 [Corynebacterium cyclohexanicum]
MTEIQPCSTRAGYTDAVHHLNLTIKDSHAMPDDAGPPDARQMRGLAEMDIRMVVNPRRDPEAAEGGRGPMRCPRIGIELEMCANQAVQLRSAPIGHENPPADLPNILESEISRAQSVRPCLAHRKGRRRMPSAGMSSVMGSCWHNWESGV